MNAYDVCMYVMDCYVCNDIMYACMLCMYVVYVWFVLVYVVCVCYVCYQRMTCCMSVV